MYILRYRKSKRHITTPDTARPFLLLYRSECIYLYVNACTFSFSIEQARDIQYYQIPPESCSTIFLTLSLSAFGSRTCNFDLHMHTHTHIHVCIHTQKHTSPCIYIHIHNSVIAWFWVAHLQFRPAYAHRYAYPCICTYTVRTQKHTSPYKYIYTYSTL